MSDTSDPILRVYAIWFNMYPGDARAKWPSQLLTDPRVDHYWDEARDIGRTYLSNLGAMLPRRAPGTLGPTADAMWDAYYVYDRGSEWADSFPLPVSWGYPIMVTRDQLLRDVRSLLAGKAGRSGALPSSVSRIATKPDHDVMTMSGKPAIMATLEGRTWPPRRVLKNSTCD